MNRRESPRLVKDLPIKLKGPFLDYEIKGRDISTGGVFIEADGSLSQRSLDLIIDLPEQFYQIQATVEIVWKKGVENFGFGTKFVKIDDHDRNKLKQYISDQLIKNKNIFITGATGFIGKQLIHRLAKDNRVTTLVRAHSKGKIEEFEQLGVKTIFGDLLDPSSYVQEVKKSDYVFHLGALFNLEASKQRLYETNVIGTKNLLDSCKGTDIKRFVHFSTAVVSGISEKDNIDEQEPYPHKFRNWYEWSKAEGEKLVFEVYKEYKLPITIVRPAIVYGPGNSYGFNSAVDVVSKGKLIMLPGNGMNKVHLVHVEDVIAAAIHLSKIDKSIGKVYNICDDEPHDFKKLLEITCKELEMPFPRICIPRALAKCMFRIPLISNFFNLSPQLLDYFIYNHSYSNNRLKVTDYTFKYPSPPHGFTKTLHWYRGKGACNVQEKRKFRRLSRILPVRIDSSLPLKPFETVAKNISEGGMFFEVPSREKFSVYISQKKRIVLKVDLSPENCKFESSVRIVWLHQEEQKNVYGIGVKFVGINPIQKEIISSYISKEMIKTFPLSVQREIPSYILYSRELTTTWFKRIVGEIILFLATFWVKRQRPYKKTPSQLSKENVRELYDSEAMQYLWKHAKTTHRNDDSWRLWLAQILLTKIKQVNQLHNRPANHIDLFAGTGLSYLSQAKVFHLNNVAVNSILLDYSMGMLKVAKRSTIPQIEKTGYATFIDSHLSEGEKVRIKMRSFRTVELVLGDTTNLTGEYAYFDSDKKTVKFQKKYFDVASIMFGIGGVELNMAMSVSEGLLKILKVKGEFVIVDMHRPVSEIAGRWGYPFPVEFRWAWFEREGYRRITVPYVLNYLWGWRDPTLYPHLMKLSVVQEENIWYGWKEKSFVIESQTWDFGMPTMPIYKQVLSKMEISSSEAEERIQIANWAIGNLS